MDNRAEVRDFLTTRRARITPELAGLPVAGQRRVPGLRRSEVAAIAGLSVEYYARLERGQIAGASSGVLEALARALQLDDTERAHLYDLARAADGIPTSGRARRRPAGKAAARLSLRWAPCVLRTGDRRRRPHAEPGPVPVPRPGPRDFYSEDFRRLWADHNVRTHGTGTKRFHHPVVGELTLAYEELAITAEPGLVLLVYTAEPGSPSAERLHLLRELGIGLVAYSPLGRGFLTGALRTPADVEKFDDSDFRKHHPRFTGENFPRNVRLADQVQTVADQVDATSGQVALAWLLAKGDDIVPIPGTKRVTRVEENAAADTVTLTPEQIATLDALPVAEGGHHTEEQMQMIER